MRLSSSPGADRRHVAPLLPSRGCLACSAKAGAMVCPAASSLLVELFQELRECLGQPSDALQHREVAGAGDDVKLKRLSVASEHACDRVVVGVVVLADEELPWDGQPVEPSERGARGNGRGRGPRRARRCRAASTATTRSPRSKTRAGRDAGPSARRPRARRLLAGRRPQGRRSARACPPDLRAAQSRRHE